ncbi:MAG: hypothetical protein JWO31_2579 [Phycisphaerales bacterium]|nr:hypothetical protein [Phycisphaerales bacterium]
MGIRILLADDQPLLRKALRMLLATEADLEVVEAADGATAVRLAAESPPDVVVMDLNMPGLSGVDATRRILADHPGTKVLVLSGLSDERTVRDAFDAGATGYVVKDAAHEELAHAVRTVLAGKVYLSPGLGGAGPATLP